MKAKLFFLSCFFLILRVAAVAQTGSGNTPEAATDVGKSAKWDNLSHQGRSGDYLIGKVIVAGGALPWDSIPITVTCDGKIRYTANADPKGSLEIAAIKTSFFTLRTEGGGSDTPPQLVDYTI